MDDAVLVRDPDRAGGVPHHGHRLGERESGAKQPPAELLALEPLHGEPGLVALRAVRDVADDARVIEGGEQPRLAIEARHRARHVRGHHLERDRPPADPVGRAEHHPHPALARDRLEREAIGYDVSGPHAPTIPRAPAKIDREAGAGH
ncbi:MAG: hypothetical protein M5U28_19455 [Sandaracinaceae bacterium]|nr:hypothetical protein [Sandaracinaceae bacterium]